MFPVSLNKIIKTSVLCALLVTPATFVAKSEEDAHSGQIAIINSYLSYILSALNLKSILDLPCGDFGEISRAFPQSTVSYIGANPAIEIIEHNAWKYGTTAKRSFQCCDPLQEPVPSADLVITHDYLSNLSKNEALSVINKFKQAGAKYLFAVTDSDGKLNKKDLCKHFPKPILTFKQKVNSTKVYMAVWKLASITCS